MTPDQILQTQRIAARQEIKRQVKIALETGRTVPYDLRILIEAGISNTQIAKVYRRPEPLCAK